MKITSFSNSFNWSSVSSSCRRLFKPTSRWKNDHATAYGATVRVEWWIYVWSSWISTSSSAMAAFSLMRGRMICSYMTAVDANFENLYFTR